MFVNSKYKYSAEKIQETVTNSLSIAQCLTKLGIITAGGNYATMKKYIKLYNIDTSHFTGMLWSKNVTLGPKRPIQDYLSNKYAIGSHKLKLRLLREKIKQHICEKCGNTKWLENPIPLELHHIDGNSENNLLENIQFLCPNCHTLTNNYRGKGKKLVPAAVLETALKDF